MAAASLAIVAGCGGDDESVKPTCDQLSVAVSAAPPYRPALRQASTLRAVTTAFSDASVAFGRQHGAEAQALADAARDVSLAGAELERGFRQPIPGSGAELNREAHASIRSFKAAAVGADAAACRSTAGAAEQRLRVPEL